nr:hypothetical protein [Tanacetum cinerariifolium]
MSTTETSISSFSSTWRMHPNKGEIAEFDADEDVTLEEVAAKVAKDADDDEVEPTEHKEVIEVATTAKLMTKVVTSAATTITTAQMPKASATRRRKGVVSRDPEETATPSVIVILSLTKKQKLDEEVDELKTHLQIILPGEDDVYTEATPLALKLFLSFINLLRNFDKEDLEMLWKIVQERFASSEPKNFSDDFLLNALRTMFEKPDVEASIWKNQRGRYGLEKVKSWKFLKSYGVHIITFTTTQMILLVERRYPLTRFTLDQMLNNVRLEVEDESEMSLKLLRFMRRQQQEGYRPE